MSEALLFGFLKYNRKEILKLLHEDAKDDWFRDPLRYEDYQILKNEIEYFDANVKNNYGKYVPPMRDLFYIPKENFTHRYSLECNYYDRFLYLCLVWPLIKIFDPLLNSCVFSHRYSGNSGHIFRQPVHQWAKFEGVVRCQLATNVLLVTDIQNFYENISLDILRKDLYDCLAATNQSTENLTVSRLCIDTLIECLSNWCYDSTRGLPQNRDCSSFLANLYLKSIDDQMIAEGYKYYRYMDDIRIVCKDKFEGRRALHDLVRFLRAKKLSLNGQKTKLLHSSSPEFQKFAKPSLALMEIDVLLNSKKKVSVILGYGKLKQMCLQLIHESKFADREFRFCINRLSLLARCREYQLPVGYWSEITDGLVNCIVDSPAATDTVYTFLATVQINSLGLEKIENYLTNTRKAIYEWQNYHIWRLLVLKKYKSSKLLRHARRLQNSSKRTKAKDEANLAGAIIYLAECGAKRDKIAVKNSISRADSNFLQRHKWIACKDLDWIRDGVESQKEQMHDALKGTYRVIARQIGFTINPPEPTRLVDLMRTVHQYE